MDFVATYGPWILPWKTNNVDNWLHIECPKMCANDPNDFMIAEKSSLKEGVANEIMKRAIENQTQWATDSRRVLPLWRDTADAVENDAGGTIEENATTMSNSDDSSSSMGAADVLMGTFNALKTLLQAQAVRDAVLITRVLQYVHNCDGRQNKTLGQAMNAGQEAIKSWSRTLLVWGPTAILPNCELLRAERIASMKHHFIRRGMVSSQATRAAVQRVATTLPVPIDQVYHCIQEAIIKDAAGPQGKQALEGLGQIIADLYVAYKAREEYLHHLDTSNEARKQLGIFLPLRCGHNNPLRKDEHNHVTQFLKEHGWL